MRRSLRAEASMTPGLLMVIVPMGSLKVKYRVENLYMYSDSAAPPVEGHAISAAPANAREISASLDLVTSASFAITRVERMSGKGLLSGYCHYDLTAIQFGLILQGSTG